MWGPPPPPPPPPSRHLRVLVALCRARARPPRHRPHRKLSLRFGWSWRRAAKCCRCRGRGGSVVAPRCAAELLVNLEQLGTRRFRGMSIERSFAHASPVLPLRSCGAPGNRGRPLGAKVPPPSVKWPGHTRHTESKANRSMAHLLPQDVEKHDGLVTPHLLGQDTSDGARSSVRDALHTMHWIFVATACCSAVNPSVPLPLAPPLVSRLRNI